MWPQMPVQTKVRVLPWMLLLAVGLSLLPNSGSLGQPPAVAAAPRGVPPSRIAKADIPRRYLQLYRKSGDKRLPWTVLAAIGKVETDHGRMRLPGVRSGLNRYRDRRGRWRSCCAGPMQFNLVNGPPSTWDAYGRGNVYDPADAIPAARRLLLANGAQRDLAGAIYSYNHSRAYVARVLYWNHRYARRS